jgi:biopolymer transport protein ExbB
MFFRKRTVDTDELGSALKKALNGGDSDAFVKRYEHEQAMAARVVVAGIREQSRGVEVVSEVMNSEKVRARGEHERLLVILGTLGNNAPFIGLFGTVLGIIKAFDDLRKDSTGGADVVHGGISEALVATAVGLLVAIPAVIAFNYFNRRVREALTGTDEIAHVVLGELHGADRADA